MRMHRKSSNEGSLLDTLHRAEVAVVLLRADAAMASVDRTPASSLTRRRSARHPRAMNTVPVWMRHS